MGLLLEIQAQANVTKDKATLRLQTEREAKK